MAEGSTEAATTAASTEGGTSEGTQQTTTTGEDVSGLKSALDKEREARKTYEKQVKELTEKASKFDEIEAAKKTAEEKLTERATQAETRAAQLETEALRYRVAVSKGIPAELVERLRGDTEEEMTADADQLLQLLKPEGSTAPGPRPDLSQGSTANGGAAADDPLLRDLKAKLGIS